MTILTGTVTTYGVTGIREDLEDIISNVDPTDKPFTTMIGTTKVDERFHEWQTDNLRDASTSNAYLEGDEYSYAAPATTTRVGNRTQILRETLIVSRTTDAVNKAGRGSETARLLAKKGQELALDREKIMLNNQASVVGSASVARKMAGVPAWLETNALRAAGGADGGWNASTFVVDAATDSTTATRTFVETLLKDVLQSVYTNASGAPKYLLMSPYHKRLFSSFPGISDLRHDAKNSGNKSGQARIIAGADMYDSDFGPLTVMMSRLMRPREVLVLNPQFLSRGILRPMKQYTPAETSDANTRVIICEETLIVRNEAALGIIADLNTQGDDA